MYAVFTNTLSSTSSAMSFVTVIPELSGWLKKVTALQASHGQDGHQIRGVFEGDNVLEELEDVNINVDCYFQGEPVRAAVYCAPDDSAFEDVWMIVPVQY